jgi:hypothetical protein
MQHWNDVTDVEHRRLLSYILVICNDCPSAQHLMENVDTKTLIDIADLPIWAVRRV